MRIVVTPLALALLGMGAAGVACTKLLLHVEPQVFVPTASRSSTTTRYPWKTNIVTTVFWVGEQAGGNNPVPNYKSAWDANWTGSYGGFDNPEPSSRRNYIPVAFVPRGRRCFF